MTRFGTLALLLATACDTGGVEGGVQPCPPASCCTDSCGCAPLVTDSGPGMLPPKPSAPAATANTATVFAISKFYFGDADRSGRASSTAWQTFGLNIDGKVTAANSTDVCKLVPGALRCTQLDGDNGIDNSFGENVLGAIHTLNAMYDSYANNAIKEGGGTLLIRLDSLGPSDAYSQLPGALYRATPTSQRLKWDGTDIRAVDPVSLAGGDTSKPVAVLPDGYMNSRVWVSGISAGAAYLDLQVTAGSAGSGLLPPIPLRHVQIAMQVAPGNASATSGVLSGVARTQDVIAWIQLWSGTISRSLCGGSAAMSISSQFEQMSDIIADGTNEPGKECDGISVGLGFDAVAVQLGKAEAEPPFLNPCSDGGTDATSSGD